MEKWRIVAKKLLLKGCIAIKKNKRNPILWMAVLMGIIASWETRDFWRGREFDMSEPRILVALRDLPANHLMAFADYKIVPLSLVTEKFVGHAVDDQQIHRLQGARLLTTLKSGRVLTSAMLEIPRRKTLAEQIPRGARAYFVEAQNADFLTQGSRVDLILRPQTKDGAPLTILENLLVLDSIGHNEKSGVTLALIPDDIELLEKALLQGKLSVALRNPEESVLRNKSKKRWSPKNPKRTSGSGVQVITEAR